MVEQTKANAMGKAFMLGRLLTARGLACDSDKWITTKPEHGGKGSHVLIDGETGQIKAGMGGKFNGQKISKVRSAKAKTTKSTGKTAASGIDLSHPEKIDKSNILQNRDRSTQGSIMQMKGLAQKPDYMRLGVTNDFGSGAPVVAYGDYPKETLGRVRTAVMPDGTRYKVQYAVVDANDVLTSNNIDGQRNADYYSDDAGKKRAIAGNGRITAMREAYKNGTADDYKREMMEDDLHGVDPAVIEKMKAPVLVRIMQASDVTPDIGDRSNVQSGLRMTAVETANNDKNRVDLSKLQTYDDGSVTLDSLKEFISKMPISEQGELVDADGNPTKQAADRLDAAIFAKAYENDGLTRLMAQALDPESRVIINALKQAAPKMQRLSDAGEAYDVRNLVARAAERAINARRSGRKLSDEAAQTSLIDSRDDDDAASAVVKLFADNPRSSTAIAQKLGSMADRLHEEAHKEAVDLFGEVPKEPKAQVIKRTLAQDAALRVVAFWNKRGRSALTALFSGGSADGFFADLRKELRR